METVLKVQDLRMHFPMRRSFIGKPSTLKAVDGVSFSLFRGETLGLVGESGCGKSTLGRCLIRLYDPSSGCVELLGTDITALSSKEMRPYRSKIQMIFQDPYASLNPRMTVYDILSEPLRVHHLARHREAERVADLMEMVGLTGRHVRKYPHEFSGGQRQRISIARALAVQPEIIVCDEPISALDVSIQAQILNLLQKLQKELKLSYIFIAHDLAAVKHISQRVAVMYLGKVVECGSRDEIFNNPKHPYTRALLSAVPLPDPDREKARRRTILKGDLPNPLNPPKGCVFSTRCPDVHARCHQEAPILQDAKSGGQQVSCHLVE